MNQLQERYILEKLVAKIDSNEKLLENAIEKYQDTDLSSVIADCPAAYVPEDESSILLPGQVHLNDWEREEFVRNKSHSEALVHKTMRGECVRSKSEVVIANILFAQGIPYRYEEMKEVGDHVFAADFSVLTKKSRKVKIIEHFGKIGDKEYLEKCACKIKCYLDAGYRPYEDILFTFEDKEGNINAQEITRLIKTFCL